VEARRRGFRTVGVLSGELSEDVAGSSGIIEACGVAPRHRVRGEHRGALIAPRDDLPAREMKQPCRQARNSMQLTRTSSPPRFPKATRKLPKRSSSNWAA